MKIRPVSGKAVKHPRRTERREAAKLRQAERAKRSDFEQLDVLKKRPGQSKRERNRLAARITTAA